MRIPALAILLTSTIAGADSRLPAHYAKLLTAGSTWTYEVSRTTWDYDQLQNEPDAKKWKKKTEKLAPITCKVARVQAFGTRSVSEVTCDREEGWKFIVAGIYFADRGGLYRYNSIEWPASLAEMGKDADHTLLVAASPKTLTKRTREGDANSALHYTVTHTVRRDGKAWCISDSTSGAPHDGTSTTCFGGTITRIRNDVGGELDDLVFRVK